MANCNQLTPLPFKGLNNDCTTEYSHVCYNTDENSIMINELLLAITQMCVDTDLPNTLWHDVKHLKRVEQIVELVRVNIYTELWVTRSQMKSILQ